MDARASYTSTENPFGASVFETIVVEILSFVISFYIYIYLYLLIYFCKIKVEESWVNLIKLLLLNLLNFVRGLEFNRKIALNFLSPPPSFMFSRRNQRFRSLEKFKRKKSRDYLKHDLIIKSPLDINSHRNVMSKLNRT